MKTTIDIQDAKMTLSVIAYEHDVPYNTINTASELIDWLAVPPDIYILEREGMDPAIELVYDCGEHCFLKFTVRERSINIIDGMLPGTRLETKYMATIQDCINVYKQYHEDLKKQFSFYEESF